MKINAKIVLALLCISFCPLLISSLVFYYNEKQRIQYQVVQHLESVASIQHARILNIYNQNLEYLKLVTSRTHLKIGINEYSNNKSESERVKIDRIISDAKSALDDFKNIIVYSVDGDVISATKAAVDLEDESSFQKGLIGDNAQVFEFDMEDGLLVHVSGPLYIDGELVAVLVIELSSNNLLTAINDYTGLGKSGETILATRDDNNDALFLTPTRFLPDAALNLRISGKRTDIPIINATNGEENVFFDFIDYRDISVLAVTRHVDIAHWGIVVKIDKEEAFSALVLMRNMVVITIFIVGLLSIIITFWISRKFTRPLIKLTFVAQAITEGDLNIKADENIGDEFGLFAKTFNSMTSALHKTQTHLFATIEELKNKNELISANSERFDRWKESNFIGIAHADANGIFLDVNETFLKMLGYTREEMLNGTFSWKKLTPKEHMEKSNAAVQQADEKGYWTSLEKEYIHKDGHLVPVLVGGSRYNQSNKEYIIFIIDLTKQKRADAALRESKEYLKTTLYSIGDAVIATDIKGLVTQINPVAEQLTGWKEIDAIGEELSKVLNIVNSKTHKVVNNPVGKVLSSGVKVGLANHTMLIAKSGEEFQISDSAAPILTAENEIIGVVLVFRDVSDEYKLGESLEKNEQQYRNLFEHNDVSIWDEDLSDIYDEFEKLRSSGVRNLKRYFEENSNAVSEFVSKVRVTHVNQATLKLFGVAAEDVFLASIDKYFGENALSVFIDEMCAIWDGQESFRADVNFKSITGQDIFAIISFNIPKTKKDFQSVPVTIQDITALKNAQNALKENEKALIQSQKMDALGKLTGGIAHDYNNMLGVILGYSELLMKQLDNQTKLFNYVSEIYRAGERGVKLTQKLLAFSRKKPAYMKSVDINHLLRSDEDMLRKTLTATIDLQLELFDDLWTVRLDPSSFQDMLLNLSINASQAMKNGGSLIFATENNTILEEDTIGLGVKSGDFVCLTIKDTGDGMSDEVRERIFEPFYTTRKGSGTGLGLSQVYGFVNASSGVIKLESGLGKGTSFRIYFPRDESAEELENSPDVPKNESNAGTESILVVDDEDALCELAELILLDQGYQVLTATSGSQALDILKDNSVDVLLTDIIMPNITGYQLAKQVRALYPNISILFASGFQGGDDLKHKEPSNKQPIIDKPYKSATLLYRVRSILDGVDVSLDG